MCRPRPFAFSSALTAHGLNASAAIPYTVSVGSTTRSPRAMPSTAARIPQSRSATVRQSYSIMATVCHER